MTGRDDAPPGAAGATGGEGEEQVVRWVVSGRVQGVGFRWFVRRRAEHLGVTGRATNLPDGRVEILGRGSPADLDALEAEIRTGPTLAHVESVEKSDIPHDVISSKSFDIY